MVLSVNYNLIHVWSQDVECSVGSGVNGTVTAIDNVRGVVDWVGELSLCERSNCLLHYFVHLKLIK